MAISLGNSGASGEGTTSLSLAYPSGIVVGDLLVLCIAGRTSSGSSQPTASGFSATAGDNMRAAAASGGVGFIAACVLVREATGSESGSVSVTATNWTSTIGQIYRFANATGVWDDLECASGDDFATDGGTYTVALDTNFDPPDMAVEDYYVSVTGLDQVAGAVSVFTNVELSATGITIGFISRDEVETELGDGCRYMSSRHIAETGSSTAEPVLSADVANASGFAATVLLRLREGEGGGGETAKDWLHYFRQYSGGQA